MSGTGSRRCRRWSLILAAVSASAMVSGCGTRPTVVYSDQLTQLPEALLTPCQLPRASLPGQFSALELAAQAEAIHAAHAAEVEAFGACLAHHAELAAWVRARAVRK